MTAYLLALWRGEVDGPALWLAVIGAGVVLGLLLVLALCKLVDWLADLEDAENPDQVPPVPMHRGLEELPEITDAARTSRARFTSLIAWLAVVAVPVIALTR